jgi:membrane associated rhomboid family serine protease
MSLFSLMCPAENGTGTFPSVPPLDFAVFCASVFGMIPRTKSGDYEPVCWLGRQPLYASTLLVCAHLFTMLGCAVALAAGKAGWLAPLVFDSGEALPGFKFWQCFSYAFLHVPDGGQYYIWFALEMFLLFAFGREVERYLGRSAFLKMYALLVLLPVLALTALGPLLPARHAGSGPLHLAVFVAFAALYPNVEMLFSIPAKWLASVLVGAAAMQAAVFHDWGSLLVLCVSAATALVFVGRQRSVEWLSPARIIRKKSGPRRRLPPRTVPPPEELDDSLDSLDPLLDKIAAHGIASLTPQERAQLENARQALLRKG